MNKICFNQFNEIIGFNLCNCSNYINIFDVDNIAKTVYKESLEEKLDSIGRRIFLQKHKRLKKSTYISSMEIDDFEDDNFIYEKQYICVKKPHISYLSNESHNFTLEDILNSKKEQLIEKYNAQDCILFENFDNIFDNSSTQKCLLGKTFIRIDNGSKLHSNEITIPEHSQIFIYCESDNDINILLDGKKVALNKFIKHSSKNIKLEIKSKEKSNIYSIAILIK